MKSYTTFITNILITTTLLSGTILASTLVSADDDSVVDEINITIPESCSISGTVMTSHNANIANGTYQADIGTTTLHAFCNDSEGFAIYAAGYTGDTIGETNSNKLVGASTNTTIETGLATSAGNPDVSNWAMKLAITQDSGDTTGTNAYTIDSAPNVALPSQAESGVTEASFSSYHVVPNEYTKVAHKNSATDMTDTTGGVKLTTTYAAYISKTQPADTYSGQVIYTLVHPHLAANSTYIINYNANTSDWVANIPENQSGISTNNTITISPIKPEREGYGFYGWCTVATNDDTCSGTIYRAKSDYSLTEGTSNVINLYAIWGTYAELDTGKTVNTKMKTLAAGTTKTYNDSTSNIKAIRMADSIPSGFVATINNTISSSSSIYPVYIWFDNTNNLGILNVYTDADRVRLNGDSGYIFTKHSMLSDISGLENWDSSIVTALSNTFSYDDALSDLRPLLNWDLGNATFSYQTFMHDISITSLDGLQDWDTTSFGALFSTFAECSALTDISALSSWDTSNIETFQSAFYYNQSLEDLSPIYNWDTSSAVSMKSMFSGDKSIKVIDVSNWKTENVTDMSRLFAVGEEYAGNGQLREIIGLDSLNVSNVTDMTAMFYGAGNMVHYDIAGWDVSRVTSFNHMFADNLKLESLDLSQWNVSSLKTIYNMFNDAESLATIGDISHWNTSSLIDASGFLTRARAFVSDNGTLDLSGWNTTNLKSMTQMFMGTNLIAIDLSGWTFDSITNTAWEGAGSGIYYTYGLGFGTAFQNTSNLQNVYISQSGLNSFNAAVSRGINASNMWTNSNISGFTLK